jgi:hypothetical protein
MKLKIIDNFLEDKDIQILSNLKLKECRQDKMEVYHNSISNNEVLTADCLEKDFLLGLNKRYHEKAISILKELYPEKLNLYDYSEFHIIEIGKNFKFPIHDDTPNKLLSGVVYLKPFQNIGTNFYSSKFGKDHKVIDWKINRAVFFARKERKTWHSFEGDGKSNRVALVYNLMTSRIKDAYKVEEKNYIFGKLRYKLNPYLYRFFKFTI